MSELTGRGLPADRFRYIVNVSQQFEKGTLTCVGINTPSPTSVGAHPSGPSVVSASSPRASAPVDAAAAATARTGGVTADGA
ncbi:hypothetical protein, partial [Amycolatopsis vancoresmycina]|uniref:hypothetical protein n=1 Tax=Amycolatopsis vancoresmycina TaxID=208444 RepID=UPI00196A166B